jgi:hypothetical protein
MLRTSHLLTSGARCKALEEKLQACVDWTTLRLADFSAREKGTSGELRIKALAELAVAYCWMHSWDNYLPASARNAMLGWRSFLQEECENAAYGELARKRPSQAYHVLIPYLCLRASGYRWPYHDETLSRIAELGYPFASETLPYRVLDQSYFLWKSGWLKREPAWRRLCRQTTLARARSILYLDDVAAYSVTHTIFYLTDFGHRSLDIADQEPRRTRDLLDCLLIHYWRTGHWDLVGELLTCLACLRYSNSVIYAEASFAFERAWHEVIKSSGNQLATHLTSSTGSQEDPLNSFFRTYHTTLVLALSCTLALRRFQDAR